MQVPYPEGEARGVDTHGTAKPGAFKSVRDVLADAWDGSPLSDGQLVERDTGCDIGE
jgi:hypothetical protein